MQGWQPLPRHKTKYCHAPAGPAARCGTCAGTHQSRSCLLFRVGVGTACIHARTRACVIVHARTAVARAMRLVCISLPTPTALVNVILLHDLDKLVICTMGGTPWVGSWVWGGNTVCRQQWRVPAAALSASLPREAPASSHMHHGQPNFGSHVIGCSSFSNSRYSSVALTVPLPPVSTALGIRGIQVESRVGISSELLPPSLSSCSLRCKHCQKAQNLTIVPSPHMRTHACTHACTHARTHARTHTHTHTGMLRGTQTACQKGRSGPAYRKHGGLSYVLRSTGSD